MTNRKPKLKKVTVDDILKADPCWHDDDIKKWFRGRKYVTISNVLRSINLDIDDKLWFVDNLTPLPKVLRRKIKQHAIAWHTKHEIDEFPCDCSSCQKVQSEDAPDLGSIYDITKLEYDETAFIPFVKKLVSEYYTSDAGGLK